MRNVFEVLTAGSKRKGPAIRPPESGCPAKTPAAAKGTYTTCPLCQRTVPLAFAEAHVSVCLATPASQPQSRARASQATPAECRPLSPPPLGLTPSTNVDPGPHTQPQPSVPGGSKSLAPGGGPLAAEGGQPRVEQHDSDPRELVCNLLESSDDDHDEAGPGGTPRGALSSLPQGEKRPQQLQKGEQRGERRDAPADDDAAPTQGGAGIGSVSCSQQLMNGPSAFDIMRQSQLRAAARCHTFFLERTSEGGWLGHCWAKGCATPAQQRLASSSCWTVTLSVAAGGKGGPGDGSGGKETVVLLTNVAPGEGGEVAWDTEGLLSNALPPEGRWRGGLAPLKSALQKAVRLGRGSCAVRAALHLAKEEGGAAQLLRRLSIVCVEDAILHPGLPLVVWLMAAQAKGFRLGATHLEALLWLVYQLARVDVRDGLPEAWGTEPSASAFGGQGPATMRQVDDLDLPPAEACLVKCLLLRASYGGMGGDVRMMRGFAALWAARFRGAAAAPPSCTSPQGGWNSGAPSAAVQSSHAAGCTSLAADKASRNAPPYPHPQPHQQDSLQHEPAGAPLPFRAGAPPGPGIQSAETASPGTTGAQAESAGPQLVPPESRGDGPGQDADRPGGRWSGDGRGAAAPCEETGCGHTREEPSEAQESGRAGADTVDGGVRAAATPMANVPVAGGRGGSEPTPPLAGPPYGCAEAEGGGFRGGCGGTQSPWFGLSQVLPQPVVSDAYFAARLQAEDAPASCGGFMPASQLMAEAVLEQQSLQRLAQAQASRRQSQLQSQIHWAGGATPPFWTPGPAGGTSQLDTPAGGGSQGPWAKQCEPPSGSATQNGLGWCGGGSAAQQQQSPAQHWPPQGARPPTDAALVPRWCGDGATAKRSGGGGSVAIARGRSLWLSYLCDLYDTAPIPGPLSKLGLVGPMRRSDVPLSAIDFHVSDVVTRLLERPDVLALATSRPGTTPEDAEEALKAAMWHFRSSKNPKAWVHTLSPCCRDAPGGACAEHSGLAGLLADDASRREKLAPLWGLAAPWADRFSAGYIGRRFGPP